MHESSLKKMEAFVRGYLEAYRDRPLKILDLGARKIGDHPTYQPLFAEKNWEYTGVDIEAGENVDIRLNDVYDWREIAADSYDVVVSGQVFEHIEFPWETIREIRRILRPGGLCCLIAPSAGPEHRYPVDCWRIYPDGMRALAKWGSLECIEVFTDWGVGEWADTVAVFQKPVEPGDEAAVITPQQVGDALKRNYRIPPEARVKQPPNTYAEAYLERKEAGDREGAIRTLYDAVADHPDNLWLRTRLANMLIREQRFDALMEHLHYFLRQRLYTEASVKLVDRAMRRMSPTQKERLAGSFPDTERRIWSLAKLADRLGAWEVARIAWERFARHHPEERQIRAMIALSYRGIGERERFEEMMDGILRRQLEEGAVNRTTIVQKIIDRLGARTYLEIGVERGVNFFQIRAPMKVAVDPDFIIPGGTANDERHKFFAMTSDEFFRNVPPALARRGIDVALVDGLHTYAQSLADVENCLRYLNPGGVVVMHDCLPDGKAAAAPTMEEAKNIPGFGGGWTGDVYKTVMHLRASRPDLFVAVVDADWGVGIVRAGDEGAPLDKSVEEIRSMTFEEFFENRTAYLNLQDPSWFDMWVGRLERLSVNRQLQKGSS